MTYTVKSEILTSKDGVPYWHVRRTSGLTIPNIIEELRCIMRLGYLLINIYPDVETEHEYPVIEDSERRDEQCQKKNK